MSRADALRIATYLNHTIVWQTIEQDLPGLREQIANLS